MATDTFSSDVNPLASPWASVGSFNQLKALTGVVVPVTGSSDSAMRYGTSSATISRLTVGASGDGDGGPAVFDSSANGYVASFFDGNLKLYEITAGSFAELGSAVFTPNAGDVVEIDITSATNVLVKVNSVTELDRADSTFRAGLNPSIFIFGSITFTDWTDGEAGGIPATRIPFRDLIPHRRHRYVT